jgi:L-asparagine transporter-like permease
LPLISNDNSSPAPREQTSSGLVARLNLFDATMIVMGGIVGAGIFMNPYVVARQVHTPALILMVWILGGLVALAGAFVYAELAGLVASMPTCERLIIRRSPSPTAGPCCS